MLRWHRLWWRTEAIGVPGGVVLVRAGIFCIFCGQRGAPGIFCALPGARNIAPAEHRCSLRPAAIEPKLRTERGWKSCVADRPSLLA